MVWGQDTVLVDRDRSPTVFDADLGSEVLDRLAVRPGSRVLDVSRRGAALATAAAGRDAEVVIADRDAISDLGDRSFDAAVSTDGLSSFLDVDRGLRELGRVTRPGGRVLVAAFGVPERAEFLAFYLGALQLATPDLSWPPTGPAPTALQLAEPAVLHRRLEQAGLHDVRVEPLSWRMRFDSARHFWDAVTDRNPFGAGLADDLTERQIEDVQQVLDGMFRERSGGTPDVVLRAGMNLGTATVRARRGRTSDAAHVHQPTGGGERPRHEPERDTEETT